MLRFIFQELLHIMQLQHYFNTSHVTVYHTATKLILKLLRFQYISCYGLSDTWDLGLADVYIFQYISCYGLSNPEKKFYVDVTLFQYISCYGLSFPKSNRRRRKNNFNTSHVTVYQEDGNTKKQNEKFQYISCYGLSI